MKECCSPWLVGSAGRCNLVRLNLVSLSFPTSDPPPFVGRTPSSFSSAFGSRNMVVFFVLVWTRNLCEFFCRLFGLIAPG